MAKMKRESIADFLHCASILEKRAYLLCKSLADKVNLPLVNSLMLHISYDSRKHSTRDASCLCVVCFVDGGECSLGYSG